MATNTTPSEFGAAGLDPTGQAPRPEKPKLTAELRALGVTGHKWNSETGVWEPQFGGGQPQNPNDPNLPGDGGAKAPDPYAPIMRSFFSAYFKIWGTLPPPGYVEGAARSMNLYEFIDQERKKPAYRHTKAYKNEAAKYAALRDQLLGYY